MEKLRIHRTKYRNRGQADKKLKGQNEHHVIFKFDTEEKAKGFITQVKEWRYSPDSPPVESKELKDIGRLANFIMVNIEGEPSKSEGAIDCAIRLLGKNAPEDEIKTVLDETTKAFDRLADETNKLKKDELPKIEVKKIPRKRPGPQKGKGGRPVKKNIQG